MAFSSETYVYPDTLFKKFYFNKRYFISMTPSILFISISILLKICVFEKNKCKNVNVVYIFPAEYHFNCTILNNVNIVIS